LSLWRHEFFVLGMRLFQSFTWQEANLKIYSTRTDLAIAEIKKQRKLLEDYINRYPEFRTSLVPLDPRPDAPEIAARMHAASKKAGVGPMAAVAGAVAQSAAEAVFMAAAPGEKAEAIIENGGDIYLAAAEEVVIALYAGAGKLADKLALLVKPDYMPVSICSSSSTMGHSLSFGDCDLAAVAAAEGALADAAATFACNSVKAAADINPALDRTMAIAGVKGVLIVKGDNIGMAGDLPPLIKHYDKNLKAKITKAAGVFNW
jgi:uncharacterized protein